MGKFLPPGSIHRMKTAYGWAVYRLEPGRGWILIRRENENHEEIPKSVSAVSDSSSDRR